MLMLMLILHHLVQIVETLVLGEGIIIAGIITIRGRTSDAAGGQEILGGWRGTGGQVVATRRSCMICRGSWRRGTTTVGHRTQNTERRKREIEEKTNYEKSAFSVRTGNKKQKAKGKF